MRRLTRPSFLQTMHRCINVACCVLQSGSRACARRPRRASLLQAFSSWCLWSFSEYVMKACAYTSSFSRNWRFFRGDILRSGAFLNFLQRLRVRSVGYEILIPLRGVVKKIQLPSGDCQLSFAQWSYGHPHHN